MMKALTMSNRMYAMLNWFTTHGRDLEQCRTLAQNTFGALIERGYLDYRRLGFYITDAGLGAMEAYTHGEFERHWNLGQWGKLVRNKMQPRRKMQVIRGHHRKAKAA